MNNCTSIQENYAGGVNLVDLLVYLQAELSEYLAGCVILDPIQVLPMIKQLDPSDMLNECAKRFLLESSKRLMEMQNLDVDQLSVYLYMLACDCDLSHEFVSWILLPKGECASQLAKETIRDIKLISITLFVLNKYKLFLQAISLLIEWKRHGQIPSTSTHGRN